MEHISTRTFRITMILYIGIFIGLAIYKPEHAMIFYGVAVFFAALIGINAMCEECEIDHTHMSNRHNEVVRGLYDEHMYQQREPKLLVDTQAEYIVQKPQEVSHDQER